jgi:ABC-type branched-subunit amino acid transport system substrate-binding protein
MKIRLLWLGALLATLAALGACRSEPVEIKVVETVEVEVVETVEVEKVVEVEKEVTVVATVEVEKVVEVPAEAEEQEYVLGIVLPFTGSLGSFGTGFRNGIELAVEQMNERLEAVGSNIRFTTVNADT